MIKNICSKVPNPNTNNQAQKIDFSKKVKIKLNKSPESSPISNKNILALTPQQEYRCMTLLQSKNENCDIVVQNNQWRFFHIGIFCSSGKVKQIEVNGGIFFRMNGFLFLDNNTEPRLLKQIGEIRFQNLVRFYIPKNNIQSIENLHRIHMPALQKLWVGDNKIMEIRSMRKVQLPSLSRIFLHNNPIKEMQTVSQWGFRKLFSLSMDFLEKQDYGMNHDLSWTLKIGSPAIQQLDLSNQNRAHFLRHSLKLKRKHQQKNKKIQMFLFQEEMHEGEQI